MTDIKSKPSILKLILQLLILVLIGAAGFYFYKNSSLSTTREKPKTVAIKYKEAPFNPNLNNKRTLAILTHPRRYRSQFNQLVRDINLSILHHTANRLNLSDSIVERLNVNYDVHHEYLEELYYKDFMALKDTNSTIYETWFANDNTSSTTILNEIASKYTCFLVNQILQEHITSHNGKIRIKGYKIDTPCGIAMNEALRPMMKRLAEAAEVKDFVDSQNLLSKRTETLIMELGTVDVRDKKGLNKKLQTKVFGYSVSSTDLKISAMSIAKIGFKLDSSFQVKVIPNQKLIEFNLPNPVILSHEAFPKIETLSVGWMRELSSDDFNKNFNLLRKELRKEILTLENIDKAKNQAKKIIELFFGPILKTRAPGYKIKVIFPSMELKG